MKKRVTVYFVQLLLCVLALLAARELTEWIWLVPGALRKQSPIDTATLFTIVNFFLIAHGLLLALVQILNSAPPFSSLRRFMIELYAALVATSLAASSIFLFTSIPFSANYFAWAYLLITIGYFALLGCNQFLDFSPLRDEPARSVWGLLFSPWSVVIAALVASPGLLAGLYKLNRDFSNVVNGLRASLNNSVDSSWALLPAYPGHSFEQPMYLAFEPERDESLLVLSRTGRLYHYTTAPDSQEEVLLDLSDDVRSLDLELGAYSFVLHPEFNQEGSEKAGFAYVYYTHVDAGRHFNRLERFDLSAPTEEAREESRTLLIELERRPSGMHHGGGMLFGPDGFLYFSLGDFLMHEYTQQIDEMLISGIFRIDVDMQGGDVSAPIKRRPKDGVTQNYYIPLDNPWVGEENVLEEYWALGFRNPWRMSMDPATGSIWLGDVGLNLYEEYNRVERGDNGQWNYWEGPHRTDVEHRGPVIGREIKPIYYYKQTALARAATGGLLYRGAKHRELQGWYIFADNQAGTLHALDPDDPEGSAHIIAQASQFGQLGITNILADEDGDIYLTMLGSNERPSGEIVRLVASDEEMPDTQEAPAVDDGVPVASNEENVDTKYLSVCSRCHGKDGKGAPQLDAGQEMVQRPDFTSAQWQEQVMDEHLRQVIIEGGEEVGLSEQMPAWGDFFTDVELDLLVEKIRSFGEDGHKAAGNEARKDKS